MEAVVIYRGGPQTPGLTFNPSSDLHRTLAGFEPLTPQRDINTLADSLKNVTFLIKLDWGGGGER